MAGQWCDEAHADGCEPQEVWIGLRCHADTPLVGGNGTVLRLIMRDDLGQMVQTDLAVGTEDTPDRSGGLVTKSWVHYALVVDGDTVPTSQTIVLVRARPMLMAPSWPQVGQFIDGTPVREYGFGRFGASSSHCCCCVCVGRRLTTRCLQGTRRGTSHGTTCQTR